MLKITHKESNTFNIKHDKKVFEVTVKNLFTSVDYYTNFLYDLRFEGMTLEHYSSLLCDFDTEFKAGSYKTKNAVYCSKEEFYKDKLTEYIINNSIYYNSLYEKYVM